MPLIDLGRGEIVLTTSSQYGLPTWDRDFGSQEFVKVCPSRGSGNTVIPEEEIATCTLRQNTISSFSLQSAKVMALGIAVNGAQRGETYLWNVVGTYSYLSTFLTEAEFIIGQQHTAGQFPAFNATGNGNVVQVSHMHMLPASHQHQTFVRQTPTSTVEYFTATGSICQTIAIGPFAGGAQSDNPVIFGIRITGTGIAANVSRLEVSLTLQKYHKDLVHFDPSK